MLEVQMHRETRYCNAIRSAITTLGHATNRDLLSALQIEYPELSATTVHRATARLATRGEIGIAPNDKRGAVRYDASVSTHDHFSCSLCDRLCDANIKDKIITVIEETIQDCSISGNIVITGVCKKCSNEISQKNNIS